MTVAAAVEAALNAIAAGEMIVVVDDEDRENEGDLVMAAEAATPEAVAFMIRHTSGILCTPLEAADARRLRLAPMVAENDAPLATAFTVSIDAKDGLTTGISATERCTTIRKLVDPQADPDDFVRPGHVFPLIAKDGGVLMRTGHTEAAVDLARMAGCAPVGLISEMVNDDGTVMKGQAISDFAAAHKLAMVSIDQLIAYRQSREALVERVGEGGLETAHGAARFIRYRSRYDAAEHLAIVFGTPNGDAPTLVRLQQEDALEDVFGAAGKARAALARIAETGTGVLVYLRKGAAGVAVADDGGRAASLREEQWRDVGLGAQILTDLGVKSIRVLSSRERRYVGLDGFGITVAGTELF